MLSFFPSTTTTSINFIGPLIEKNKRHQVMNSSPQINNPSPKLLSKDLPIRIVELEAKIENRPTMIDEKSSAVLKYRTPHFR